MKTRHPVFKHLAVLLVAVISLLSLDFARANAEEQPVIHIALFYSTSCGHCHYVMTEVLPPLQEKYGNQLDIRMIELASQQHVDLLYTIATNAGLEKNQVGVPFMLVGDRVLIGSVQIPDELPGLIEAGVSGAGIDFPDIPGLRERIEQVSHATEPASTPAPTAVQIKNVEVLYFYSNECPECKAIDADVLQPLENQYGDKLTVQRLDIDTPGNYELLTAAEEKFGIQPGERSLPTLILGGNIREGEASIREDIASLLDQGFRTGVFLPDLPGLEDMLLQNSLAPGVLAGDSAQACDSEDTDVCASDVPVWAAYFYQADCPSCSRIEADIKYVQSTYPQLSVESFNIDENADLATWMADRLGENDFKTPALFIGEGALIGGNEITPDAVVSLVKQYQWTGAEKTWQNYGLPTAKNELVDRFSTFSPGSVALGGLVDGFNPIAFAVLILFVSTLILSGRKARQILVVGGAFVLGIFIAFIAAGTGLYQLLDLSGNWLAGIGRWVYVVMAVVLVILAVVSFNDFLKVRRGEKGRMSLDISQDTGFEFNTAAHPNGSVRGQVIMAFLAGIAVCLLEFPHTGQIILPTLISVSSIPSMQVKGMGFLSLYSLLFIIPLVVVLVLAYYLITFVDLQKFLQENIARVKLGMGSVFTLVGIWLFISLI